MFEYINSNKVDSRVVTNKNIALYKNSCSIKFYDIDLFFNELVFFVSTF